MGNVTLSSQRLKINVCFLGKLSFASHIGVQRAKQIVQRAKLSYKYNNYGTSGNPGSMYCLCHAQPLTGSEGQVLRYAVDLFLSRVLDGRESQIVVLSRGQFP